MTAVAAPRFQGSRCAEGALPPLSRFCGPPREGVATIVPKTAADASPSDKAMLFLARGFKERRSGTRGGRTEGALLEEGKIPTVG